MKRSDIESKLRTWFDEMVNRYTWLSIKFEYSEDRRVYLVSYSPKEKTAIDNDFINDAIAFEDKMNMMYGDYAPLFCDEEKYFLLSENAEIVKHTNYEYFSMNVEVNTPFNWEFSQCVDIPITENNYALAA